MSGFLVDVNLPYRFSIWNKADYIHQFDLGDTWTDREIWDYAKKNHLTIITKDSDFSDRIIVSEPPPKVIHIKLGNMKISRMFEVLSKNWETILDLSKHHKLVNVHADQIIGIE